MTYTNSI